MSHPRTRAGLLLGTVAALLLAGVAVATTAGAAAGCRVAYAISAQWNGGFTADVTVTVGDPVNGWRLGWTFPAGQRVTQAWNATVAASGSQVTATNASWNAAIGANASVSFGFNGSWTGSNPAPASFALNGVACAFPMPSSSATSAPTGNPAATVAAMQPGWNLGNTLDAIPDETA